MTPAARLSAGIDILDSLTPEVPVGRALTGWARRNRYAGSKDRAAIRDLVFDILRQRRSCAAFGGGNSGRALVLGYLQQRGEAPEIWFTGAKYAPRPLSAEERLFHVDPGALPDPVRLDFPDWLEDDLRASLGSNFAPVMATLRTRAPVFLRVNLARSDREQVIAALARAGIAAKIAPLAASALEVTENARRITQSAPYKQGLVELQDAASQAIIAALDLPSSGRILDYCAGGGGKSLAMAARTKARIYAHDTAPARMRDLPLRAQRAGVKIPCLGGSDLPRVAPFDLVLCDAPCSGSGAWRRAPAGKWALTRARLDEYIHIQGEILRDAAKLVAPGGSLAYATCSILTRENTLQAERFISENSVFTMDKTLFFMPSETGDGMFIVQFNRML